MSKHSFLPVFLPIVFLSALFVYFSQKIEVFAQAPNTFNCRWDEAEGACVVGGNNCNPGYEENAGACEGLTPSTCNSRVDNACRSVNSEQRCFCNAGVCTPTNDNQTNSMLCSECNSPTANAACRTSQKYRCEDPSVGCIACERLPNGQFPSGCLDLAQCTISCSSSSVFYRCQNNSCVPCDSITDPGCMNRSTCDSTCGRLTSANIRGTCGENEISTAIGCIPFGSSSALVTFFVSWGLGIGGGVAMLSLIYAGFMTMTSAGDPKRLEMGKELVVSSLSGIVLLAFSIFVLRLIGVDILGLFGN